MIKQKKEKNKKAIFFSLDALIALIIILLSITVIYPIIKYSQKESYVPEDIILSLSVLKIGDINSAYVNGPGGLIAQGKITDLNKSILEQIGEFYVSSDSTIKALAYGLAQEVLLTINTSENIGIWYNNDLLASNNKTSFENAKDVSVENYIISGIKEGNATTGYSARAFLTNSIQTKYYYFGGYVGEGNISLNVQYNGTLINSSLEITANKDFHIYINDIKQAASFQPVDSEFEPKNFPLEAYVSNFNPGINNFKIVPVGGISNLHIAGGYLKLTYEDGVKYEEPKRYYFPGIEGLINLYDGFYVPGVLTGLDVYLHFKSNYTAILTIGNKTVKQTTPSLFDQELNFVPSGLDYSALSKKTIPIRFGLENISQVIAGADGNADVILITDLSGSMQWKLTSDSSGITRECNDSLIYDDSTKRISLAKCLDKNFITKILSVPGNRVGLVGFTSSTKIHSLSDNLISLNTTINSYSASGGTCICCGINQAYNMLKSSDPLRKKFIVVMSDGVPNYRCTSLKNCPPFNADISCPFGSIKCFSGTSTSGSYCGYGYNKCDDNTGPSVQNAIWSSNRTHSELNANISSVGFTIKDCHDANFTLSEIAKVGGGVYRLGNNATELLKAYSDIASSIISISYHEQIVNATENISAVLYPDSYIEFDYIKEEIPYGIVITKEKLFSDVYSGSFNLPTNSSILETKVISYSGPRWTKEVSIDNTTNNNVVYNLSEYGNDYTRLGDPYSINIPNFVVGESNLIRLTTGVSTANFSAGSEFNKIIYTILKDMVSYSAISEHANGCNWIVQFEDDTYLTLEIPTGATDTCYYKSDDHDSPSSSDALKTAVYNLFKKLDLENNGKLDIKFTEQNLEVSSSEVRGIPFPYETIVQVRKWW